MFTQPYSQFTKLVKLHKFICNIIQEKITPSITRVLGFRQSSLIYLSWLCNSLLGESYICLALNSSSMRLVTTIFTQHFSLKYNLLRILTRAFSSSNPIRFRSLHLTDVTSENILSTTALLTGLVRQFSAYVLLLCQVVFSFSQVSKRQLIKWSSSCGI